MLRQLRTSIVLFTLGATVATAVWPVPAFAEQSVQTGLELHRWKYKVDENDRTWLNLRFVNTSNLAVIVNAITISSHGQWTTVAKRVEPDGIWTRKMLVKDKPASVWLDTNRGVARFDLSTD